MRSGKCPAYKYDYSVIQKCKRFNEKDFECRKDSDCKKPKQKCCKNSCSLLTCQGKAYILMSLKCKMTHLLMLCFKL